MPIIRISEVDSGLCTLKIIKISVAGVVSYLPMPRYHLCKFCIDGNI